MPHATALSMLEDPRLDMAAQNAIGFHDDIAYVDYQGLALDYAEGERLARALGSKFERLYFLERACQAQVLALSTGRKLRIVAEAVVQATVAQFRAGDKVGGQERTELHFAALKRLLDRSEADYAS